MAYKHCPEARRLREKLQVELDERGLVFSAAEELVVEQVCACLDRKHDLQALYRDAVDASVLVKLSAEIRLLESTAARMLKQVSTEETGRGESAATRKARKAAQERWRRHGA